MTDLFFKKEKKIEKYEIPKKETHFDIIKKINYSSKYNKNFNGILFLKQLSYSKKYILFSNLLNVSKLNNEQLFEIAKDIIPKVGFIKFIKKEKEDKDLSAIMWYFKVNKETAKRYKNQLSKKEIKEIIELYKEI